METSNRKKCLETIINTKLVFYEINDKGKLVETPKPKPIKK